MKLYVYDFAEFSFNNFYLTEDGVDSFELQGVSCEEIVVRNFFEFKIVQDWECYS